MIAESQDEAEIIRIGEEAVRAVRQTFERWMEIGRALEVGRHWAMAEAGTNQPIGRTYAKSFSRWLERHPVFGSLKESTRSWTYRCYENRVEIAKWREERGAGEIDRYNYPETVFKRWRRYTHPKPDGEPKPPTVNKRDQSLIDLQQENDTLSRGMEELRAEKERLEEQLRRDPRRSWSWFSDTLVEQSPSTLAQSLYAKKPDWAVATARAILELDGQTDAVQDAPAPALSGRRKFNFWQIGEGNKLVYPYDQAATSSAAKSFSKKHKIKLTTRRIDDNHTEVTWHKRDEGGTEGAEPAPTDDRPTRPVQRRRDRSEAGAPDVESEEPGTSLRDSAEISTEVTRDDAALSA